jgi:isoleucyl-tRNA synthetase
LGETNFGVFNRKKVTDYWAYFKEKIDHIRVPAEKGESLNDVRKRMYSFIRDVDVKHAGKKILIVTHGDPGRMLAAALEHLSDEEVLKMNQKGNRKKFLEYAEVRKISYDHLPTDDLGHVDPHRPYIDEVTFACGKCGKLAPHGRRGEMKRVPEVADVWFDSGSMPFAQGHYPFAQIQNSKLKIKNLRMPDLYPADYICEAMDQTRGWFYTLLAVATALGMPLPPYKNVISLGLIHDKQGQKMSKSRGNIVDPWALMQKYGVDAVRWYFYTLNDPGEAKNFDELDVQKALRRFHMVAYNSFSFLSLYGKKSISVAQAPASPHILDKWILGRLAATSAAVTEGMDAYNIMKASAALELFTDDLSRWYIRRSRRRLQKPESQKDWEGASATLAYALVEYAKLIAPFTPFFAEGLFQSLKKEYKGIPEESVHLAMFTRLGLKVPRGRASDLTSLMQWVRDLASAALAKRAELQIKVRQPLAKLSVKKFPYAARGKKAGDLRDALEILKDELNVKEVTEEKNLGNEFELDTVITPELKAEGLLREFVRTVQDLRQEGGLMPKDKIELWLEGSEQMQLLVRRHEKMLVREVGAKKISIGKSEKTDAEIETKVDEYKSWIGIKKVKGER